MDENFFNFYAKLVALNSISSETPERDVSNEPVIDFLGDELSRLGFAVRKLPVRNTRGKFNLVARLGAGEGGLAFCGHTDTVPCDPAAWTSDPFVLTERDGRLYGLGAADMKGFFACARAVAGSLDPAALRKPVYVIATADEETNMGGAAVLREQFDGKPDLIVVGEPTSMTPVVMHKGHLVQGVRVRGRGGHSSDPAAGVNAVKIMHEVVAKLIELEEKLKTDYREPLFAIPHPTLNIGRIAGGDAPNRICESCELLFDIRPLPGHGAAEMAGLTREALDGLPEGIKDRVELFLPYEPTEPFGGKIAPGTVAFLEEVTGRKAAAVNYATEATYYQEIAETVVLGPGSIAVAHRPDEYLDKAEIPGALAALRKIAAKYCLG